MITFWFESVLLENTLRYNNLNETLLNASMCNKICSIFICVWNLYKLWGAFCLLECRNNLKNGIEMVMLKNNLNGSVLPNGNQKNQWKNWKHFMNDLTIFSYSFLCESIVSFKSLEEHGYRNRKFESAPI